MEILKITLQMLYLSVYQMDTVPWLEECHYFQAQGKQLQRTLNFLFLKFF